MAWRRRCRRFETALHRCPKLPQRPLLRGAFCSAQGTVALYILDTQKGSCMFLHFPIWGDKNLRQGSHDKLPTHVTSCLSRGFLQKRDKACSFHQQRWSSLHWFFTRIDSGMIHPDQSLRWPGKWPEQHNLKRSDPGTQDASISNYRILQACRYLGLEMETHEQMNPWSKIAGCRTGG